ncbi:PEP-CTERM sorting domain-containing protein [Erythrobacter sp. F6033]|uniref:PEP-CTERM sorting domain-containing protein n=1 Tax=Erythrobacter sp. F6033 TaxID=2926401 RepID=UPI001FF283B9|nr:PEP-CTERM sorting domain-containing protein [Erythrobacter sp. F6033]MCK0129366.1 PEP-CTERM sorting domain-containing protein [Erythrobacter sp. F6033]
MSKLYKSAAIALAASTMAVAAPASADIFEYEMTNGDILTIDTDTQIGTWKGNKIDVSFTSPEFANFQGGANPSFTYTLTDMTGTRSIRGTDYTPTRQNGNRFHPWMMKTTRDGRINLWSWWGDPVIAGDYVKRIGDYRVVDVPAPGIVGLLALALAALGFGRRRRKIKGAAAA